MPLPTITLPAMITRARGAWRTQFPGYPMGVKQFLGQTARAVAVVVWALQKSVEDVDLDIVPQPQSSSAGLQTWAFLSGLPNGAGGYGSLVPTTASGGAATLTGAAGTIYPGNALAVAEDGTTQIALSGSVTIPGSSGSGSVGGTFVAVTAGTVGNLPVGTRCTWVSPPAGADPVFTLTTGLSGATDTETNAQIYGRLVPRFQNPPNGGTSSDILKWAKTVPGISGVYCFPRRSGTGTVDVVLTLSGSGQSRVPGTSTIASVQAAFDANRVPGSEAITAMAPWAPNTRGHLIQIRVVPNGTANAFDWGADAPGTAYTVFSYSAGPPATITLSGLAPTSLKNAIAGYIAGTNAQPRLQVLSTGSVINLPIGTSKTVTWSDSGGRTTITLDALPSGWVAPTVGDTVYPYGPVVSQIATNALALVDSLGPSRQSGYADTILPWTDTLYLNQLARVAEDATDANGNVLITEVLAGGVLIDGSSASDLEGIDATNNPPELLYASHIAVTQ